MGIMIGYSIVSLIVLYFLGTTIALLFVSPEETEILNNAHTFLLINSATSFLLAFVINFRYVIQGLGFSNYALFAGLFEMVARTLVAFLLVPHLGFTGACLANPAAWLAADSFLIPCYFFVMRKLRARVEEVPDIPLPICPPLFFPAGEGGPFPAARRSRALCRAQGARDFFPYLKKKGWFSPCSRIS